MSWRKRSQKCHLFGGEGVGEVSRGAGEEAVALGFSTPQFDLDESTKSPADVAFLYQHSYLNSCLMKRSLRNI